MALVVGHRSEVRALLGALAAAGEPLKEGQEAAKALAGEIDAPTVGERTTYYRCLYKYAQAVI